MICSGRDVATGNFVSVDFEETIRSVSPASGAGNDLWIAPGFVDIQVNGFAGVDFNRTDTSQEDIGRALDLILSTGVARCLPTVITGPKDDMVVCLRNLVKARRELPWGHMIAGFHVEGPHISAEEGPRGAHPIDSVRAPDLNEYRKWQEVTDGAIRLITLSPHWEGAREYIAAITRDGVTASIGHTHATAEQISAAVDAGATLSTHINNAAHPVLPKHTNYVIEQLAEDRLSASFIIDGIHLSAAFVKVGVRAKTVARCVLVTDASAPAGAKPGRYRLGRQDADLTEDGRVVLTGTNRLAGSALKMNNAVANVIRMAGITLREAVDMATVQPARIVRMEGRTKGLVAGERGDVVLFRTANGGVTVDSVYVGGKKAA